MPAFVLLGAASVASLNLCADEYLLLLARPKEIVSVSFLSRDPLDSPLWRRARAHHGNRGSFEQVLPLRPSLVLTMGGGGRATALLARRVGIATVDLTPVTTLDDVADNLRRVAAALGDAGRARPWTDRLERLRRSAPASPRDAIWLSGAGDTLAPGSAGTQWLRLAGLAQRLLPEGQVTLETLLVRPPQVLVQSNYGHGRVSRGSFWQRHPIVRRAGSVRLATDGRAWTCMGPLLIDEIERLRKQVP